MFILVVVVQILFACSKKDSIKLTSQINYTKFSDVFNDFWLKMNQNYVYWNIDTTDWDNAYQKYQPLFSRLNLNDPNDVKISISYFKNMTKGLVDSHFNISFSKPEIKDSLVFPALNRKIQNLNYLPAFSYATIDKNYLDSGYVATLDNTNDQGIFVLSGTINKNILYFYCNKFSLSSSFYSTKDNPTKTSLHYFFSQLQNNNNLRGIVIDVRDNPGGDTKDLNFLTSHLINKPLLFGFTRYKSGNGRLDYTPWIKAYINPSENGKLLSIPIIALADGFSASVAEAVALVVHSIPNGMIVGEKTWGATGPITENEIYNDGQFDLSNFLHVTTSSSQFKYLDDNIYEGKGFSPDVFVPYSFSNVKTGKDDQLEKAISIIN